MQTVEQTQIAAEAMRGSGTNAPDAGKRTLAIIGITVGLVLVIVAVGLAVNRSGGTASKSGQKVSTDPCRAGLSLETLYQTGLNAQSPGHWSIAIDCATQIAKTNPGYKQTLYLEAWALWNTGQRSVAIDMYRAYLRLYPKDAQGWLNLGYSLIDSNDCKDAVASLNTVLGIQPANTSAVHDLMVCGDLDDAYAAALRANEMGNYAATLTLATEIAAAHPDLGNVLFLKAWAQWNLGQREQAVATYRLYLKGHPTDVQAQFNLGYGLIKMGKCSEAVAPLKKVLSLQPSNQAARTDLSVCGMMSPPSHTLATATPTGKRAKPSKTGAPARGHSTAVSTPVS
jgi:Flp pilus assembly protein TadD